MGLNACQTCTCFCWGSKSEGENFSVELILDWMPVLKSAPKPKAKEGPVLVVVHAHRASDVKKAEGKHKLRVVAGGHQATSQVGEAAVGCKSGLNSK